MSVKKPNNHGNAPDKPTPIEALLHKYNFKYIVPAEECKITNDVYELIFKKYRIGVVVGSLWVTVYRCSQPQLIDIMSSAKLANLEACEALIESMINPTVKERV